MRYEDGTIGLMHVAGGRIQKAELLSGDASVIEATMPNSPQIPSPANSANSVLARRILPVSGRDIQDEKSVAPSMRPPGAVTIWEVI
jgi:hypothetical protein